MVKKITVPYETQLARKWPQTFVALQPPVNPWEKLLPTIKHHNNRLEDGPTINDMLVGRDKQKK